MAIILESNNNSFCTYRNKILVLIEMEDKKVNILVQIPRELYDRIPSPKKRWGEEILIEKASRLPEVERDEYGDVLKEYVFISGEDVSVAKGTSTADAWLRLGWPGFPDKSGLKFAAIAEGWYVVPKTNMSSLLDD